MSKDLIQRLSHAYISTNGELYDEAAEAIERLTKERDQYWPYVEAVAKQRYPFTAEDELAAYEMLRERKRTARAAIASNCGQTASELRTDEPTG